MLEGLDKINWAALHHPYGTCEQIPELLLQAANALKNEPNSRAWRDFVEEIRYLIDPDNVLVITQVTPHIIPFWIQMLKGATEAEYAHMLLADIGYIVSGQTLYEQYGETIQEEYEAQGRDYNEEIRLGPTYVQQTRDAARVHFDYYLSFIDHAASNFRESAAFVLSKFPEYAVRSVPLLLQRYQKETTDSVKDEIVKSVNRLFFANKDWPEAERIKYLAFFEDVVRTEGHLAVGIRAYWKAGFQAAMALLYALRETAPQSAVDVLIHAAVNCSPLEKISDSALQLSSKSLLKLGANRGIPIFLHILKKGHSAGFNTITEVVYPLLELSFGNIPYKLWWGSASRFRIDYRSWDISKETANLKQVTQLNPQQKEVLQAIVETDKIWEYTTDLYEWYGLPVTRDSLRSLISESKMQN